MSLISVSEIREHVETGIADTALDNLIKVAEQEIVHKCGATLTQTDEIPVYIGQYNKWLWLTRPADSITTVIETVGVSDTTLAADDYRLYHQSQLKRLDSGTNSRSYWGDRVKVTYVPRNDITRRRGALIRLVQLMVNFTGNRSESSGDFSCTSLDYESEKNKILSSLQRVGYFS